MNIKTYLPSHQAPEFAFCPRSPHPSVPAMQTKVALIS